MNTRGEKITLSHPALSQKNDFHHRMIVQEFLLLMYYFLKFIDKQ
jgi:hypothetical protein